MRFGVFDHNDASGLPPERQIAERLELIEAYECLGYYAYHGAEHHGTPLGITPSPHLMLAAASQRTSTIRLGTLISILPLYHPMRVVEEACTLDQLTNGRLDLGVGRGISPIETSFHGVPGPGTQDRFNEASEIPRTGLTREVVNFHGGTTGLTTRLWCARRRCRDQLHGARTVLRRHDAGRGAAVRGAVRCRGHAHVRVIAERRSQPALAGGPRTDPSVRDYRTGLLPRVSVSRVFWPRLFSAWCQYRIIRVRIALT